MALSYKKDLDKYKDLDEDEILNKLSAEELKQLEVALEEMDPEVSTRSGLEGLQGFFKWEEVSVTKGFIGKITNLKIKDFMHFFALMKALVAVTYFLKLKLEI